MTTTIWQTRSSSRGTQLIFTDTATKTLKDALEICAAKAISLLDKNIQDDSLYLLFEWNAYTAELNIVVTDAGKQQDSPISVGAHFAELQQQSRREIESQPIEAQEEKTAASNELIKFFISDYLASCSVFFRYSLVAIFHCSTRSNSNLL
jgi:hypothetical protein